MIHIARLMMAWALVALMVPGSAHAADEHKEGHDHHKVKVLVKGEKGNDEKTLDLSKKEDHAFLKRAVEDNKLVAMEEIHERSPLEIRFDVGFWTIIVFVLLCLLLKKLAWLPMLEGLQKREDTIVGALKDAENARAEAQALRDSLQREMNKAHEKVREILDEARRDAQHTTDEMIAKARGEIQADRDRIRKEMDIARDQAVQELWNQTANIATEIASKAIRRSLTANDERRLVDDALADIKAKGQDYRTRQSAN